jgi:molybdopterin molybdotransferase
MIDCCNQESAGLLTVAEALQKIKTAMEPIAASETAVLKHAVGRVLSSPVYSPINIPYDRNAAMDGYAFASSDIVSDQAFMLRLAGSSWAGQPFEADLQKGECIRIFTGAVVPPQADSVVMQEQVRTEGQNIHFPANIPVRQNIRAVGEDIKQGGLLCTHSKKLTAYDLGLLAAAGIYQVTVKRKIRIAFFSTGDELTGIGRPLESGKIYDSNRYLLSEFLKDASYSTTDGGVIADNKQLLQDSLINAAKSHDVIITTGGASVGEADFIRDILASCGQVNFWRLAIKPGKPLAFGKIGDCHFFGLPGNPVSLAVTFQQLVAPALRQISGASACQALQITATCTSMLKKVPGRLEFQRGVLTQNENGDFFVASSGKQGSHILGSMSKANCYIILPAESDGLKVGDQAVVEPFSISI